jgi:NTP pyrophosphatase (non-canonical NTP hydrolase)
MCKKEIQNVSDIKIIQEAVAKFSEDRDWDQFHNGKDLAIALSLEASELLEIFLWKQPEVINTDKVKEELADVLNYAFLIANKYNLDIKEIVLDKIKRNAEKYPVEKSKGNAKKYNEL